MSLRCVLVWMHIFAKRFLFNSVPGSLVILTMNDCCCLVSFLEPFILIFKINGSLNASFKQSDIICLLILKECFMVRSSHEELYNKNTYFFYKKTVLLSFLHFGSKTEHAWRSFQTAILQKNNLFHRYFSSVLTIKAEKSKIFCSSYNSTQWQVLCSI